MQIHSPQKVTKSQASLIAWGLAFALFGCVWAGTPNITFAAQNLVANSRDIQITLQGSNITEYLIAETPNFLNTSWTIFVPDASLGLGPDGENIDVMHVPFTLSEGDGEKIVYIKYRNVEGAQSEIMTTTISLTEVNSCVENPEAVTGCEGLPLIQMSAADQAKYRLGVSPITGDFVPTNLINPGDYIRGSDNATVYCVTSQRTRRPFMDETTYFTQKSAFAPVKWVESETLSNFPLDPPMLPHQDVVFLKFESDENVYYFVQDPLDPAKGILHWVSTEELAAYIAGPNWADYVIDLNPTLTERFVFSAPFITVDDVLAAHINVSTFRARELLNEQSASTADSGVQSSLFEQGQELLRAAGNFFKDKYRQLTASILK
ncbi:MAG: hypothetical protein QG626_153 [Patescibacteria group bacterium]|jgi:hypothetical protein|nr:hypothetical protein [Patescibacteria group bacterium]